MANKVFKRAFAKDFLGIDGEQASIEPDGGAVNRAVNYEYSVGNSLRGRVGCQVAGTPGGFFAIFPYSYTRTQDQYDLVYQAAAGAYPTQTPTLGTTKTTADGATVNKLIALNKQAWVLDTMNITVTQTVAATYTWYSSYDDITDKLRFYLKKNGTTLVDFPLQSGISSYGSIYDLLAAIDSTPDLAVSRTTRGVCPPFAIVNGNQTSVVGATVNYGTRMTITVLAGHNFYPGDIITFVVAGSSSNLVGGVVISTTGTTITYVGPVVNLLDGDIVGYLNQSASAFPISTLSSETAGVLILSFPYWRLMPEVLLPLVGVYGNEYSTWSNKTSSSFYAPPTAISQNGCLYIAASNNVPVVSGSPSVPAIQVSTITSGVLKKIDGVSLGRAGVPYCLPPSIVAAGGALTGTYKYKAFIRKYDAQGNILDGSPGNRAPGSVNVTSITYAAQQGTLTLNFASISYANAFGFNARGAFKYTAEAPAANASFYIDDNTAAPGLNPFIQPGDPIYLLDNVAPKVGLGTGTLHRTVCTSYDGASTPASIRVADSSGYTIPDNSPISAGLTMVVLRTAAGGNQYYVLAEVPVTGYATYSFVDNVADGVLTAGEQYIEIPIGKEHDIPPFCSVVCQHQGGLVVSRGLNAPNTVGFSTADGIEYFPLASNSFDIPSTQSGAITAIASDTTDRLAVFKERAYYDIQGDLDGGLFSVNVKNEGDYGITSQASLKRVNNALWGLSKNGWVVVQDGFLDPYKFKGVSARLINQNYQWGWAVAENDYFNRQYLCSIPQVTGEPVTYALDYSRNQIITLERSYTTQIDPVGGMAMIGDTLYHLSSTSPYCVFRRLIRFNGNSPTAGIIPSSGDGDSFIDNTKAISYILESQPINFGEPGLLKTPIRIRIWSVPNDYVMEGWVVFPLLVETGASPIAQYVGSGGTNNTSSTVNFNAATDVFKDVKLKKQKGHFYIIRFTTNTIRRAPFITGYEIMFAEDYDKEDFVK